MVFEEDLLGLGEGAGEIGRHQLAEALTAEDAVLGASARGVGRGRGLTGNHGVGLVREARPDALARRLDGARIDLLVTDGGNGLLESLFGLHDASPMRLVISLRRR